MRKLHILIIIILAIGTVFWLKNKEDFKSPISKDLEFSSSAMLLALKYPDNYVVEEKGDTLVLMTKEDYLSVLNGEREGGEGPAAITIRVIDNPNNPSPRQWIEQYPQQSNYNLRLGDVIETSVAGFPAISYEADGLYPNRNLIFERGSRLYYINGQYLDRDSDIYRDFQPIVDSIRFK